MTADSSALAQAGATSDFSIEQVESLGKLAVVCVNSVLKIHHAAWLGQTESLRREIETLAMLRPQIPDYPFDDPFANHSPTKLGCVEATSAHAASFLIGTRCLDLALLSHFCIGPAPALPGSGQRPGLLSSDVSESLHQFQRLSNATELLAIAWECETVVERIVELMRAMLVTGAPQGLAQGEAFRAAERLRLNAVTVLAVERIAARNRSLISPESNEQEVMDVPPLTEKQRQIREMLKGRALSAKELAKQLDCDPSRLFRDHIKPLMRAGVIKNSRVVGGYYLLDSPPKQV
jgi:hypothetical protein